MILQELLNALGIEREELDLAVANEGKDNEIKFDLSNVVIKSKKDYDSIITNYQSLQDSIEGIKKEAKKEGSVEGKKAGLEIAVKNAREKHGLEFTGKNIDNLLDAYTEKLKKDLSIEPNQLIDDLTSNKNELIARLEEMKLVLGDKDKEIENIHGEYKTKEEQGIILSSLQKSFSKLADKSNYSLSHIVELSKLDEINKTLKDGRVVFTDSKTNKVLQDENFNEISTDQYAEIFMRDNKMFKPVEGGRGGNQQDPDGKMSIKSFNESQEAQGNNVGSSQYTENLNKAVANGKVEI